MGALLLGAALVVYNGLINLWPPFHNGVYVPLNAAVAAIVALVGLGPLRLSSPEMGLTPGWAVDLALGAAIGLALAAPVVVLAALPRTRRLVADQRMRGVGGSALLYRTLVRVPIGTALFEELTFRGVLYGAWRADGVALATLASAAMFGLWHITPAREMIRANRPQASRRAVLVWIVGTIAATVAAGAAFAALREATNGIAAPFALHAMLNSVTSLAAAVALRPGSRAVRG